MKIKTKLIATIVSMCAALAVMAVGVWAAVTEFTLTINNNVNLSFATAEVVIKGQGTTTGLTLAGDTSIAETELFNNGTYTANATGTAADTPAAGTNANDFVTTAATWQITSGTLGGNLNQAASISYTYTITPTTSPSYTKDVNLTVTQVTAPKYLVNGTDVFTVTYTYTTSLDGTQVATGSLESGVAVPLDFSNNSAEGTIDKCVVVCTLNYAGTTASIDVQTAWNYTIAVANVQAAA